MTLCVSLSLSLSLSLSPSLSVSLSNIFFLISSFFNLILMKTFVSENTASLSLAAPNISRNQPQRIFCGKILIYLSIGTSPWLMIICWETFICCGKIDNELSKCLRKKNGNCSSIPRSAIVMKVSKLFFIFVFQNFDIF